MDAKQVNAVLDVIEKDIVPKTLEGVKSGCKLFGAAILRKSDMSIVVTATNTETENPLLHGEMTAINEFYALPKDQRPAAKDTYFIATHEPCSLCLSGITWGGFDNFCSLFSYEDSRDDYKTPYDIDILEQVFRVADPGKAIDPERPLYNKENKYFTSFSLQSRIAELGDEQLVARVQHLRKVYAELSDIYQKGKGDLLLP